jgi:predicted outer membrane protein
MHNHSVLKKLLAVSAVAAMFSAFGVHAQTGGSSSASGTSQDATTQTGKTTREGTAGNTNSRGEQQQKSGSSSSTGSSGSASGSSQGGTSSMSDTTGAGNPNTTGKTTSEGTPGNTNSTGMEKRQGTSGSTSGSSGSSGGASGASGASGATGASGAAGATGSSSGKLSSADQKILKDMAQANINEIEAAKLAQSKSQNDQVKSFAQQMIDDHGKALTEVQQLAQQKGVTLPTEPDAKHKAMATSLQALSGAAFDKAYMSQAGVSDHKTVHSKLVSAEKKAKDADVKGLAQKMEPVVAQHLKSAEQDKSSMAGTTSGK